jgi:hypothetical protein
MFPLPSVVTRKSMMRKFGLVFVNVAMPFENENEITCDAILAGPKFAGKGDARVKDPVGIIDVVKLAQVATVQLV